MIEGVTEEMHGSNCVKKHGKCMLYRRWRWALRGRLAGEGSKQPWAASVKSCGGERHG